LKKCGVLRRMGGYMKGKRQSAHGAPALADSAFGLESGSANLYAKDNNCNVGCKSFWLEENSFNILYPPPFRLVLLREGVGNNIQFARSVVEFEAASL